MEACERRLVSVLLAAAVALGLAACGGVIPPSGNPCAGQPAEHIIGYYEAQGGDEIPLRCGGGYGYLHLVARGHLVPDATTFDAEIQATLLEGTPERQGPTATKYEVHWQPNCGCGPPNTYGFRVVVDRQILRNDGKYKGIITAQYLDRPPKP
jgi:hypothetical protein